MRRPILACTHSDSLKITFKLTQTAGGLECIDQRLRKQMMRTGALPDSKWSRKARSCDMGGSVAHTDSMGQITNREKGAVTPSRPRNRGHASVTNTDRRLHRHYRRTRSGIRCPQSSRGSVNPPDKGAEKNNVHGSERKRRQDLGSGLRDPFRINIFGP